MARKNKKNKKKQIVLEKKKKVIVTTDDFGVYPYINEAIIEAVNKGKVNSIAALTNYDGKNKDGIKTYKSSLENAKDFLERTSGKAEIGCHLTITSGRPITNSNSLTNKEGYFRGIYKFKRSKIKAQELEDELNAQVKLFTENDIPITHLSCHHNSLTLFPELYDAYLKICKDYNLSIRSGKSHPKGSMKTYILQLQARLLGKMKFKDIGALGKFSKKVPKEYFKEKIKGNYRTPSFHDSGHYGPIPGVDIENTKKNINDRVKRKHDTLNKSLEELVKSSNQDSMEFILHIGNNPIQEKNKQKDIDYPGIDTKYFDSRYLEYKSILSFDFSRHSNIKLASWKKIK